MHTMCQQTSNRPSLEPPLPDDVDSDQNDSYEPPIRERSESPAPTQIFDSDGNEVIEDVRGHVVSQNAHYKSQKTLT